MALRLVPRRVMALRLVPRRVLFLALCCATSWDPAGARGQSLVPEKRDPPGGWLFPLPTVSLGRTGGDPLPANLAAPALQPTGGAQSWDPHSTIWESPASKEVETAGTALGDPLRKDGSRSDPAFQIPLTGPVALFGQVSREEAATSPSPRLAGKTGVAWKMHVPWGPELLLSCGPELSYTDASRPGRVPERSASPFHPQALRLDAQCRWSLLRELGLEYQGTACPAFAPWEKDLLSQDLRVVVPVGRAGQLRLGARHYWENSGEAKPWVEGSQLYSGFRLEW